MDEYAARKAEKQERVEELIDEMTTAVEMSIDPCSATEDMVSWFPMYLPLRQPMPVKRDEEVSCAFWRMSDCGRVWYEWSVIDANGGGVHNPNGRSWSIYM